MKNREKAIPQYKIELVKELAGKLDSKNTLLIASTRSLPSSQFHEIKKRLRDKAEIKVARKSSIIRAIEISKKKGAKDLKEHVQADVALFFSDLDPFELSALLTDNLSATKAKAGDIAPEDIIIEPGPTDLIPGPAISELGSVGLKVSVEGGKLAIKQQHTIVKAGEEINSKVASVLGKLNVTPVKVGFEAVAAYDSKNDKVYSGIKIDKKKAYEDLQWNVSKSFAFAVQIMYVAKQTLPFILAKAVMHEKAISNFITKNDQTQNTDVKEDK